MSGIRFAWCQELDADVTARAAKREYLALAPRPLAFHFFCQNPDCLQPDGSATRVTCVNYKKAPNEDDQSVVVHYRQLDKHMPTCPDYEPNELAPDEDKPVAGRRNAGLKTADAYDIFDPADEPDSEGVRPPPPGEPTRDPSRRGSGRRKGAGSAPRAESPSSTRFVEDLAVLHVQAKTDASAAALLERDIRVEKHLTVKLRKLFLHLGIGTLGNHAIWYGGARLKRYGGGFSLQFMDEVQGMKVSTYLTTEQVEAYRYKRQLVDLLEQAEQCRYVTGYVWGAIEAAEKEGKLKLQPRRLQHLAIILGPPKLAVAPVPQRDDESRRSKNSNK